MNLNWICLHISLPVLLVSHSSLILILAMMMMNCFRGMVARQKAFSLISSQDHCQRSSPCQISNTPSAGFKPAQNLSSGFVEWSCAVVITTTLRLMTANVLLPFLWSDSNLIFKLLPYFIDKQMSVKTT